MRKCKVSTKTKCMLVVTVGEAVCIYLHTYTVDRIVDTVMITHLLITCSSVDMLFIDYLLVGKLYAYSAGWC